MPAALTQNSLTNLILPAVSLTIIWFSAFAVLRRGWFPTRPVLSIYIWFLAITGALSLVVYFLQVPEALRYVACRVYFAIYYVADFLTLIFSIAVIYEFLFRMARTKMIQRMAIIGFLITTSLNLTAAFAMTNAWSTNTLENVSRFLFETTALALLVSGLFIFAIKKSRSLFLEPRLFMVLLALTLYTFIDLLSAFMLRRSEQKRLLVSNAIWIAFAALLYWALKKGPASSGTVVSSTSELPAQDPTPS